MRKKNVSRLFGYALALFLLLMAGGVFQASAATTRTAFILD